MTEEKIARLYKILIESRKRRLLLHEVEEAKGLINILPAQDDEHLHDFCITPLLAEFEVDLYCDY